MISFVQDRRRLYIWSGLVAVAGAVFGIALSPPFLSPPWDTVVMHAFAPVCHQIPVRSPHIGEIQIALCDRCTGIYLGFAIGGLGLPLSWPLRRRLLQQALPILLGAITITGLDWVGPILGLWPNVPISRFLTGGLLGLVAGLLVGVGLLRSHAPPERTGAESSPQQSVVSS